MADTWYSDWKIVTEGWAAEEQGIEKFEALARMFLSANYEGRISEREGVEGLAIPDYRVGDLPSDD